MEQMQIRAKLDLDRFIRRHRGRENGSLPRDLASWFDFRGGGEARGRRYESPRNPCVTRPRSLYFQPRLFSFLKRRSSLVLAAAVA